MQIERTMDEARVALRSLRKLKPKEPDNFGMYTSDTIMNIFRAFTAGAFSVLIGVVGLSLVVGGVVIMNIMLMVVSERTREIGLRKALGARKRDIVWQILTESTTLSVAGGLVGTLLGFVAALTVAQLDAAAGEGRAVGRRPGHRHDRRRRPLLRPLPGDPRRQPRSDRSPAAGMRARQ